MHQGMLMSFSKSKFSVFAAILLSSACLSAPAMAEGGWYLEGAAGGTWLGDQPGYWQSPGPGDPQITYDVSGDATFAGFLSVGRTVRDGVRADFSLGVIGNQDIHADWVSPPPAGDPKPNDHANMDTSVSAIAGMFNVSVEPLTLAGHNGAVQPFITAGIGLANVSMGDWTRTNDATNMGGDPNFKRVRTFDGNSNLNFAWSIGGGVSVDITETMNRPAYLDLSYRYIDMGNVSGGFTPISDNGNEPIEPFNFDYTVHVVSVGLRIPFN